MKKLFSIFFFLSLLTLSLSTPRSLLFDSFFEWQKAEFTVTKQGAAGGDTFIAEVNSNDKGIYLRMEDVVKTKNADFISEVSYSEKTDNGTASVFDYQLMDCQFNDVSSWLEKKFQFSLRTFSKDGKSLGNYSVLAIYKMGSKLFGRIDLAKIIVSLKTKCLARQAFLVKKAADEAKQAEQKRIEAEELQKLQEEKARLEAEKQKAEQDRIQKEKEDAAKAQAEKQKAEQDRIQKEKDDAAKAQQQADDAKKQADANQKKDDAAKVQQDADAAAKAQADAAAKAKADADAKAQADATAKAQADAAQKKKDAEDKAAAEAEAKKQMEDDAKNRADNATKQIDDDDINKKAQDLINKDEKKYVQTNFTLEVHYNTGFGFAVFITGQDQRLGAWATAYRLTPTQDDVWTYKLPEGLENGTLFKTLVAKWDEGESFKIYDAFVNGRPVYWENPQGPAGNKQMKFDDFVMSHVPYYTRN